MKAIILYHPKSDHGGVVEDYARDFKRLKEGKEIELVSLETVEGSTLAKLYDITRYPAALALADDGSLIDAWQGEQLPLMVDLEAYATRPVPSTPLPSKEN
jgi:hypothetical protein